MTMALSRAVLPRGWVVAGRRCERAETGVTQRRGCRKTVSEIPLLDGKPTLQSRLPCLLRHSMKNWIFAVALAAPFETGCSERDRMATIDSEGLVTTGGKLGVRVGATERAATRTLLTQGLQRAGIERGGTCLSPRVFPADYTVKFVDLSWRRGTVCLGITRGRVTQVGWLYNMLSP